MSFRDRLLWLLYSHHPFSCRHSQRVAALVRAVAPACTDVYGDVPPDLFDAVLLHDIGKLYIPAWLLDAPRPLTPTERVRVVDAHPQNGLALLYAAVGDYPLTEVFSFVCVQHHERWDGTGYPHRITGQAIRPWARLVAILDVYDALTAHRPYQRRPPLARDAARRYLSAESGAAFCPDGVRRAVAALAALSPTEEAALLAAVEIAPGEPADQPRDDVWGHAGAASLPAQPVDNLPVTVDNSPLPPATRRG